MTAQLLLLDGTSLFVSKENGDLEASQPQGPPLLALRTLLGLDVVDGKLRSQPRIPRELGRIGLKRIPVRGRRSVSQVTDCYKAISVRIRCAFERHVQRHSDVCS